MDGLWGSGKARPVLSFMLNIALSWYKSWNFLGVLSFLPRVVEGSQSGAWLLIAAGSGGMHDYDEPMTVGIVFKGALAYVILRSSVVFE